MQFEWTIIGVIIAITGVAFSIGYWAKDIRNGLKRLEDAVVLLVLLHFNEIIKFYRQFYPSHSETEKEKLLTKLENKTITFEEAKRLRTLLEKQKADATAAGAIDAAMAVGGLLSLLAIIMTLSCKK